MKVVSTEALTKLIQLVKSTFIKVNNTVQTQEVTLADVATSGDYNDLTNKPTAGTGIDITNDVINVTNDISTGAALGITAVQPADLNNKADTNLLNITSTGKNIANWSTNVSNCITEIPQDIKLELLNGTVTLKAGSKVYVPNGVGVFDVVTVPSNVVFHSGTIGTGTTNMMLCCNLTGGYGYRADPNFFVSGSTAPSDTSQIWYDTTNNAVKKYENGSWVRAYSLPIGIYVRTNGVATSIDQVFNGFGYIGSTVFALPGVKGLIPNGRNVDGSLKNIKFTTNNVLIKTLGNYTSNMYVLLNANGINCLNTPDIEYKEKENLVYNTSKSWIEYSSICCNLYRTSGKITSFKPKTTFHAIDYNDLSNKLTAGTGIDITNDVISVEGVKDQRNTSTAIKTWTGTKAQYNAITTKDNNILYHITDDESDIYDRVSGVINRIYPIGSIYLTVSSDNPATLLGLGTWQKVASGRVLQGADTNHTAGTTINAGLPNITGNISVTRGWGRDGLNATGAFQTSGSAAMSATIDGYNNANNVTFNASRSSSIYGNSNTVQPPAFVVNIWQRIA